MSADNHISPDTIRSRFSTALSAIYRNKVPAYGTLMELVADVNNETLAANPAELARLEEVYNLARISEARHGAIRLGTAGELHTIHRLFAVMEMVLVGYHDLSGAGVPVHSTAFRPVGAEALKRNPFRVFTSLLRLDLIENESLRAEAKRFVSEALETFRWQSRADVSHDMYRRLHDAHRLIADAVSFKKPHINHLTTRTLDIDKVQGRKLARGIPPKAVVEGPLPRKCPILLRQTSFTALEEPVSFRPGEGRQEGLHTAHFGEIERRGGALPPRGRTLYDRLLTETRQRCRPAADGSNAAEYMTALAEIFANLPDNWASLQAEGLAYFTFASIEKGLADGAVEQDVDMLIAQGALCFDPVVYEDFLAVSTARIFQSNLAEFHRQPQPAAVRGRSGHSRSERIQSLRRHPVRPAGRKPQGVGRNRRMSVTAPDELRGLPGPRGVLTARDQMLSYETGACYDRGHALAVLRPSTTEDVSGTLGIYARHGLRAVAQAGNTGLVSSTTPDDSSRQVVLCLDRLNARFDLDGDSRSLAVSAGLCLSEVNNRLADKDFAFLIDLGADPMTGGMIATNTGGAQFLRYGDVRTNVLGLIAVLADTEGTILPLGGPHCKDHTGIDWKPLCIGSFGIVTEAVLKLHPLPREQAAAILEPASSAAVMPLLRTMEAQLGSELTAFKGMLGDVMQAALDHVPSLRNPFPDGLPDYAILAEISRSRPARAGKPSCNDLLPQVLEQILEEEPDLLADARFGVHDRIWVLRHALSEDVQAKGRLVAFDLAFRCGDLMRFCDYMKNAMPVCFPDVVICDFGRIGDGGVHFNLVVPCDSAPVTDPAQKAQLRDWVFEVSCREFGSSFSARHAIGRKN